MRGIRGKGREDAVVATAVGTTGGLHGRRYGGWHNGLHCGRYGGWHGGHHGGRHGGRHGGGGGHKGLIPLTVQSHVWISRMSEAARAQPIGALTSGFRASVYLPHTWNRHVTETYIQDSHGEDIHKVTYLS